jgi:hypothetical protein
MGSSSNAKVAESVFIIAGAAVLIPLGLVVLTLPNIIINAWVLTKVWGWYISPFFGLPAMDIIHAFGVALVVRFLVMRVDISDDSKKNKWQARLALALIVPPLTLLAAWIGTWWLP